jgi:HTH-type transcriptional regulator/antitoxin MqsA
MSKFTIKKGTEAEFFKRGRRVAKAADRGERPPEDRILSAEDPADVMESMRDEYDFSEARMNPVSVAAEEVGHMKGPQGKKCPACGAGELIHDTRDLPHTYKGVTVIIAAVSGEFCLACGEAILNIAESERVMREVRASVQRESAKRLAMLGGSEPDLRDIARRRSEEG